MKKICILSLFFLFAGLQLKAQADRVIGIWLTEDRNSQIEIFKNASGNFEGKLVWMEEPRDENGRLKTDTENPDRSLRSRPLKGITLLQDFRFNSNSQEWVDGTIYDPENGRTYSAFMKLEGNNTLKIRGFVMGMRMLGRSTTWTRESRIRN